MEFSRLMKVPSYNTIKSWFNDLYRRGRSLDWFRNYYRFEECRHQWENQSSAMCDGDCSQCGAWHMRRYDSDDLTEIIEEREGQFLVYRSPPSAEHYPNYERLAKFPTLTQAKMYCDCARATIISRVGFGA